MSSVEVKTKKGTLSRLKEKEREDRINLILNAAEHVFEKKPFNSVSIQEVADEAGISKSSIYTYFTNQEQLFVETASRNIRNLMEKLYKEVETKKGDYDLEDYINSYVDYMTTNEPFYRMMTILMANPTLSPEAHEHISTLISMHLDHMEKYLFQDVDYPGGHRMFAHNLFALLNGLIISFWKIPGKNNQERTEHMKAVGKVTCELYKFYKSIHNPYKVST